MKRFGWALVWVVTLAVLFYTVENWRGKRAWNTVVADLRARKVPVSVEALFGPRRVPPEQNFAALPFVTNWFQRDAKGQPSFEIKDAYDAAERRMLPARRPKNGPAPLAPTDLIAWAAAFEGAEAAPTSSGVRQERIAPTPEAQNTPEARTGAAKAVLAALEDDRDRLAELAEGLKRPLAVYPLDYESKSPLFMNLDHLRAMRPYCGRLQLRASAELALGRPEAALQDLRTILKLAETVKDEPFLISQLVRMAIFERGIHLAADGLHERRWTASHLRELKKIFAGYDFVPALVLSLNGERVCALSAIQQFGQEQRLKGDPSVPQEPGMKLVRAVPSGWFLFEMANYSRTIDQFLAAVDEPGHRIFSARPRALLSDFEQASSGLVHGLKLVIQHRVAVRMLLPAWTKAGARFAIAQTEADQLLIACALREFELANGKLPEQLSELVPGFLPVLPRDVLSGETYHYRRDGNSFLLYSNGWDNKDNGGTPTKTGGEQDGVDWVWGYEFRS